MNMSAKDVKMELTCSSTYSSFNVESKTEFKTFKAVNEMNMTAKDVKQELSCSST